MKINVFLSLFLVFILRTQAAVILVPMDTDQRNHLKAYGIAYWVLEHDVEVSWLLNYRGGSFMFEFNTDFENECTVRGVTYQIIADAQATLIVQQIADPEINMDVVKLHKAPKIAVYTPLHYQPWDDAVTLALTYAEIPYDKLYDEEILTGNLPLYDWLHLHHEDFTGQYGKFWASYQNVAWYREEVRSSEEMATRMGFSKVSQLKLAVAKKIRDFVLGGGYLFAMCSAPESLDITLAAEGVDICQPMFDGDPIDPDAQNKLDYSKTFAFTGFSLVVNPYEYAKSSIDVPKGGRNKKVDFFTLFEFSAKWDQVPTMLCQNHENVISGFMGQATAFRSEFIKSSVVIMGESKAQNEARYIHGALGNGTFTFYGGHDPEDYQHMVNDPPTDLNLFANSPGYRLILNNVLFPAARKKKQKT
ncbi:MAG: asparagine synthetase B [Bacteroidales bacterium]|nr:asparagine synthetase B [Bacteroidales bacterium]